MGARPAAVFPPQWDPPPHVGYGDTSPHILHVMDVLLAGDYAPWVRACYVEKLRRHMGNYYGFYYPTNDLSALVRILGRFAERPDIAAEPPQGLAFRFRDSSLCP